MRRRGPVLLAALLSACGAPPDRDIVCLDVAGREHRPLDVPAGRIHVLVFVSPDCPIANKYAPEYRALATAWSSAPVRLYLVHVDPDTGPAQAVAHACAYELPETVVLDPRQRLAASVGATVTPEAAVVTRDGVRYLGRIDDGWGDLGAARGVSRHDLREAVADLLAGRPVAVPRAPAVGCLLPEPRR